MLFGLIIIKLLEQIDEKVYIIEEVNLFGGSKDEMFKKRMTVILQALGFKKDEKTPTINYDYSKQGQILDEIIEKYDNYQKYKRMLEKAKKSLKNEEKKELLHVDNSCPFTEEQFEKQIKQLTLKERNEMNLCQLDNYCLFIASRYLDSLNDHINLSKVSRRLKNNMEKYHYNPVEVDERTLKFFPNMETFHIYEMSRYEYRLISGGRISQYVDWVERNLDEIKEINRKFPDKKIEFKQRVFPRMHYYPKGIRDPWWEEKKRRSDSSLDIVVVPDSVNIIAKNCFSRQEDIGIITLPNSVTRLGKDCFDDCSVRTIILSMNIQHIPYDCFCGCDDLSCITLPLNSTRVLYGNKIFNNLPHFDQSIRFKNNMENINGEEVERLTSLDIPTFVTSLGNKWYVDLEYSLKHLSIPESCDKLFNYSDLIKFKELTSITLPLNESRIICGNKIFNNKQHFVESISLPDSIRCINGKQVEPSIIIPSFVTSIDETCFRNSNYFEKIVFPEVMTSITHKYLTQYQNLQEVTISSKYELHGNKLFMEENGCLYSIQLPSTVRKLNEIDVELKQLTSFVIPSTVTKLNEYCFAGCNELVEIIGLDKIEEFGRGCFTDCSKIPFDKYNLPDSMKWEMKYGMNSYQKEKLEEWTGLECKEVLFDSNVDNWSINVTTFNAKTSRKKQLIFLIEDEDEEKFGYYLDTEVIQRKKLNRVYCTNNKSFEFNIQSKDNRLSYPMKFEIKETDRGNCELFPESDKLLIAIGDIRLYKEEYKNETYCWQEEHAFDYRGIRNALCGKAKTKSSYIRHGKFDIFGEGFQLKRFIVIQMGKSEKQLEIERLEKEKHEKEIKLRLEKYLNMTEEEKEIQQKQQVKQLEEWTGLTYGETIFDSDIDNWADGTSVFDERIIGRKQLTFIVEDEDGEKFGFYLDNEVIEKYMYPLKTDKKSFHFNLQSNERLSKPMKFELKEMKESRIFLLDKTDEYLISIGDILLKKENLKDYSFFLNHSDSFDYYGIPNALCGKEVDSCGYIYFTPKRIIVIQMN